MKVLVLAILACAQWSASMAQGSVAADKVQSMTPLTITTSLDVQRYMGSLPELCCVTSAIEVRSPNIRFPGKDRTAVIVCANDCFSHNPR